jgi:putative acetyltransferase
MPFLIIRDECPSDAERIAQVTRDAFAGHAHGSHAEHLIVNALRESGALAISLVAELSGVVVGHIAFSPVTVGDGSSGWYGLGPLSVAPAFQRRGIGRALVVHGLEQLHEKGARGCVVLGEPSFYGRFGFAHDPELRLAGVPPEFFQSLPLRGNRARGEVTYHPAFNVED